MTKRLNELIPGAPKELIEALSAELSSGDSEMAAVPAHAPRHKGDGDDPIANATPTVAGLMSAADKTKLNAIDSGAQADHAGLTGLTDDDHPQYALVDGSRAFTAPVAGVDPVAGGDLATKDYVDNSVPDHGELTGLTDDDHPQYALVDGSRAFTAPVAGVDPVAGGDLATKDYVDDTSGRLLRRTVLTSGSGATFVQLAATKSVFVKGVGGGGGGSGAPTSAGAASCGAGGGGGSWGERWYDDVVGKTLVYTIGAGGTGGAAGANDGGVGSDTSFTDGITAMTLPAGTLAASSMAASNSVAWSRGGGSGADPTNADVGSQGQVGFAGLRLSGTEGKAGDGASGPFGKGGRGAASPTGGAGAAGAGFGSGGAGGNVINGSAAAAGGNGTGGVLIIWEYS